VYMSKVSDSSKADGSDPFFKIFEDTWAKASSTSQGSDDYWGTKDLNKNCGKMDLKIPEGLAPGDYLLRAEAIALHTASSPGGAQFYLTCFQLTVTGSGSTSPSGVKFPGAYKATDPGIEINIYQVLSTYVAPGPSVIAGGIEATAGKAGSAATATGGVVATSAGPTKVVATSSPAVTAVTSAQAGSTLITSTKPAATSAAGGGSGCAAVAMYQQCGGSGYMGCTTCAQGTCRKLNDYYSQCS
jgi:lytic cellulose monooxygenase (C1-hydroxylating)